MSHFSFKIHSWDESIQVESICQHKISQAKIKKEYIGHLEAEGQTTYTLAYYPDGSAIFSGYELITGSLNNKQGSFMIRHQGAFKNGQVTSRFFIDNTSCTGELVGLKGHGEYSTGHTMWIDFEFEYEFID